MIVFVQVLCFHLGMTEGFVWNYGTSQQRVATEVENNQLLEEIYNEIVNHNKDLIYTHEVSFLLHYYTFDYIDGLVRNLNFK